MSGADDRLWEQALEPLEAAATVLARHLAAAGESPRLAIAGGSAAAALGPLRNRLTTAVWSSLRLTWVDERRVPVDSPHSNRGEALRRGWLGPKAPVAVELPLWLDDDTPAGAIARISRGLDRDFAGALDVLLLGMGEDGHVASLFPGHAALAATAPVVCLDDAPKPPPERITLTLPLLSTARAAILVATGAGKREALGRLRNSDPSLPIARLPRLHVLTEREG